MKKNYTAIVCTCLFFLVSFYKTQAQTVVIFSEDFETSGPYQFVPNSTGGPATNTGVNQWRIDTAYNGYSIYPNTITQDSTYLGVITNAPRSRNLHIYDSGFGASQGVFNASYDATMASDRFVVSSSICTISMTNVSFSFYYTCMGDTNSYGSLYYSVNSGPWIQTGLTRYYNKTKWKYEVVTDPVFDNIANLRFGFRWQNNAGTPPSTTSMAVDDINVVATFDSTNVLLSVDSVVPNPACNGSQVTFYWHIAQPFCDGQYQPQLSDNTGSFATPQALNYILNINSTQTSGSWIAWIPTGTQPGSCYRIRLSRLSPVPVPLYSTPSPCFTIQYCPNTITTLGPPVIAMDSNAVCAGSVIDVNFFSTGSYIANFNRYKLQLSDSSGNFVAPDSIGSIMLGTMSPPASNIAYDPLNPDPYYPPPPASIGGLIPDTVRESCNYYIRVIATDPVSPPSPVLGSVWGPFCIQHCDIITNNEQDVAFCLYPGNDTVCTPLAININYYDSNAVYAPGNQFQVQVISRGPIPPPFTQVGTLGGLGSWTVSQDTTINWCVSSASMAAAGVPPGSYYMRLVATNSSIGADSSFGSMIRLTIGKPQPPPLFVTSLSFPSFLPEDTFCTGDQVYFVLSGNLNPNSSYYWYSANLLGSPIVHSPPNSLAPIFVPFTNYSGTFSVYVREYNNGCLGDPSPAATIYIRPSPTVSISPPVVACVGDTIRYTSIPFATSTVWTWSLSDTTLGSLIVDTASNAINVVFNTAGIDTLFCLASNACGSKQGWRRIVIRDYPVIVPIPDTTICAGNSVSLIANPGSTYQYEWRRSTTLVGTNDTLTVSPTSTNTYTLKVTNSGTCAVYDTVQVTVDQPTLTINNDSLCFGSSIVLDATTASAMNYVWNNDTNLTTPQLTVVDSGTYSVQVSVNGEACPRTYTYIVTSSVTDSTQRADILCEDETLLLAPQTNGTGYLFQWSTGATTDTIRIDSAGVYTVVITNPQWLCPKVETFDVTESPVTCGSEYNLPNVFSPDGSGLNDFYHPCDNSTAIEQQVKCPPYKNVSTIDMKIYNRWGELVYETTNRDINWNGKKNNTGTNCPDGVYYYTCIANYITPVNGQPSKALHGFITLLRKK